MLRNRLIFSVLVMLLVLSCSYEQKKIQNLQLRIVKNASQINRDLHSYLTVISNVANYAESLYSNQERILKTVNPSKYIMHSDGFLYSRSVTDESVVFVSGHKPISEAVKCTVYFTEPLDSVFIKIKNLLPEVSQIYYNEKHSYNRIYPPFDVLLHYQPKIDITNFSFYYMANEHFNPERNPVLLKEPYLDPAGKGWTVSAIAPVYYSDDLQGVVGMDISIDTIYEKWLMDITDANAFILDDNANLIAGCFNARNVLKIPESNGVSYLETVKHDKNLPDQFNLNKSKIPDIRAIGSRILSNEKYFLSDIEDNKYYVLSEKINHTNWFLVYMIKKI